MNQAGFLIALILLSLGGCSRFPDAPDKPILKPADAAAKAIESYDTDKNGSISADEAKASPGLLVSLKKGKIDKNGDGALDEAEIADRISYFKTARTTIISGELQVFYKRKPLPEATVTLTPEPFLGESFTSSSGVTDANGRTSMMGSDSAFPGIYLGFYRVSISKDRRGKESLPAKFNSETVVGFEATDDDELVENIITFDLDKI